MLEQLRVPIVQAPLAGGPSTPDLAIAVSDAGGLGFLAAGYRPPEAVAADIATVRERTARPFGVNVFMPSERPADPAQVERYAASLSGEGELGSPRFDDDHYASKIALLLADPVPVVSFTFGCPPAETIASLRERESTVWVTVTSPEEALQATAAGADALVLQGIEAGGHRSSFRDPGAHQGSSRDVGGQQGSFRDVGGEYGLLALIQLVGATIDLPLIAAGGIATGRAVAAVLAAGASAAQIGTAFLRTPEAGTSAVHRDALTRPGRTAVTRAFTGRRARGIVNRFLTEHDAQAPAAYPEVHYLTAPLRARGRASGDPDVVNLWAGEAYELTEAIPAGELVAVLATEAREVLRGLVQGLS